MTNIDIFLKNNNWIHETFPDCFIWVYKIVNEIKPKTFVEFGTGENAKYAQSICRALEENNLDETNFISYEINKSWHDSAVNVLKKYKNITDLYCDDMFNFFNTYSTLIPDMYLLDAGDEKLWEETWTIKDKDYSENSYYGKGISENLTMFLKIQNTRSKTGTYVLLDDFFIGRGTYISNYILNNKEEFNTNWEFKNIVRFQGGFSMALLRRL